MTGWQPIESAPKDGTVVDLWAKRWRAQTDDFEFARFTGLLWDERHRTWAKPTNGGLTLDLAGGPGPDWRVTHWQPLPEPPEG